MAVVMRAHRSKIGNARKTSAAETVALPAPRATLNPNSAADQPPRNCTVKATVANAATTSAVDQRISVLRLMVRTLRAAVTPPSNAM